MLYIEADKKMDTTNKQLLKKYLDGLCTDKELRQVKALLDLPRTEEVLHTLMAEKAASEEHNPSVHDDGLAEKVDHWTAQILGRIAAEQGASSKHADRPVRRLTFLRYAAVWAGLFILSAVFFFQYQKSHQPQMAYVEQVNKKTIPVRYLLPDGSTVYIGTGSKLRYPKAFNGDTRRINLQGQAFFDVKHDATKPFIIETGSIKTQVLGTSFKVDAFSGEPVIVSVATGKVGVSHQTDGHSKLLAMLTPGKKVTWNERTRQAVEGEVDIDGLKEWTAGDLIFDEEGLSQIANDLQRRFNIQIKFEDLDVAEKKVSGSFAADKPVEKILKTLARAGKFRYETTDNKTYTIYKLSKPMEE